MDVSIIIINYNTYELTCNCINSILKETHEVKYEIIVVDNNSQNNEAKLLEQKFPTVLVLNSPENLGFGKANNLGVSKANGKYILLLNSDTIILNNAIKDFFDYMENHSEVGIACGNLISKEYKPMYSYTKKFNIYCNEIRRYVDLVNKYCLKKDTHYNFSNNVINVDLVSGADLFISKELYIEENGFDKNFFMYYEDTDLCLRIKKKKKIVNIPYIQIIHLEGASSNNNIKKYEMIMNSKYYFYKKHIKKYIWIHYLFQQFLTLCQIPISNTAFKKLGINKRAFLKKNYESNQ